MKALARPGAAGEAEPRERRWATRLRTSARHLALTQRADAAVVGLVVFALQWWRSRSDLISPYDEGYHLSYVQYLASGHLPRVGDPLNSWAQEAFSCHDVFAYGRTTTVPCGETGAPGLYPEGGTNTSGGWPPVYYAVVTLFVRVLGVLGMDPLPAARLGSAALWAVGCALLVLVARRYGVPRVPAVTGGLVAAALPVANVLGAFVTPYAAQILVTAALCWLALSLITTPDPSRRLWLTVVLVPALAVLTVPHAVVGVLIATVAVLIANRDWRIRVNHPVVAACTSSAVAAAAYVAWSELSARRTIPFGHGLDAQAQSQLPDPTLGGVTEVLRQWFLFWPNSVAGDALGYDPWQVFVATGATYLAVGAVAAVLLRPNRDRLAPPLALALLVVAPLAAWGSDAYFDFTVPLRYGSSVIGFTCLLLAMAVRSRLAEWTLFVGVSGVLVAGVFSTWP